MGTVQGKELVISHKKSETLNQSFDFPDGKELVTTSLLALN